ncbi:MAG: Protein of unknown function (DUF1703)/Predicted AAA-ATPase [Paenibacillus sp.]|nr:Protein of unknown function (DUF1703)/Predicted AAA-ATPase [Paenibacillus sp.]
MNTVRKFPIGVSDFQKIIEEDYYYVDKSLFIKELIDSGSEVILLPRPRRFGKTLNLSMLRYFYEKTDSDTSRLFKELAIWGQGKAYKDKQGKHPVIFLTFKDVKSLSGASCQAKLKEVIRGEYLRHKMVLEADWMDSHEKQVYREIIELTAGPHAYEESLKNLSAYLYRYYGEKTVILIDEYDTPIQQGSLHGFYDEVVGFMRNLLSGALKDNSSLEKGVLTGILRIAKESIFSGLNNLEVCTLLRRPYSTHFGLTDEEVEQMLRDSQVPLELEQVREWYNGYIFGESTIYNPWSIVNFCANWEEGLQPYWVNTSSNDLIRQLLTESGGETKKELERLVRGETIRKEIDDNIVFRDINRSSETLWSFLLFSGYLKVVSKERDLRLYGEMKIPNREVAYLYEDIIRGWFQTSIHSEQQRVMLEALVSGDVETFEQIFRDFVTHTFSMFDPAGTEPEKVYHAFVLGLLVSLRDRYEVKSNRESGYGRYDVMLIPREVVDQGTARLGIILEFKKANRGETLEQAVKAALKQIDDKHYVSELEERGVRDVLKLGIAFRGKELCVETSE